MTRSPRQDDGVAALELALVSTLLLFLTFASMPLLHMLRGYQTTSSAAADALRFATSVDANVSSRGGTLSRRPTTQEIVDFARASVDDPTLAVTVEVCPGGTTTACAPPADPEAVLPAVAGDTVRITVAKDVDLSLAGAVANAVGSLLGSGDVAPTGTVTMSSTSTGREE